MISYNRYEWFWKFSKLHEPLGECNLRIFKITSTYYELYEKVVLFFYNTFNKITSFPWKLNRYSYGVQFGINCTALDQSKLSNFVECTINFQSKGQLKLMFSYEEKHQNVKQLWPLTEVQVSFPDEMLYRWTVTGVFSVASCRLKRQIYELFNQPIT